MRYARPTNADLTQFRLFVRLREMIDAVGCWR